MRFVVIGTAGLVVVACARCGRDGTALELSVAGGADMSFDVPSISDDSVDASGLDLRAPNDLVPPVYDLAWSACVGTKVAGTCAEKFFEPFVACFHPEGHCGDYLHNFGEIECWDNGAGRNQYHATTLYTFNGVECLRTENLVDSMTLFRPGGDTSCRAELADGGTIVPSATGAVYDPNTGIFTCPGGTQVDVGAKMGDCTVLNELLDMPALCDKAVSC